MSEYDMQKFAQELKILIFNCFWKNWPTVQFRLFILISSYLKLKIKETFYFGQYLIFS